MMATEAEVSTRVDAPSDVSEEIEVVRVVRPRRGGGSGGGRRSRGRAHTVWWQLGTTLVFVALVVGLGVTGYRASLLITGGGTKKVTDPKAPGYVAEVRPTPVDMVAITAEDGSLAGVLIVATSTAGAGGTVSALPAFVSGGPGESGEFPSLADVFSKGGIDQLRTVLGTAMTFGFTSAEQVSAEDMTALAGLAGPITVKNVDNLIDSPDRGAIDMDPAKETVRYRAGEVELQPAEVGPFLAFAGIGEERDRQMLRHMAVWEQILTALHGKDLSTLASAGSDGDDMGAVADLLGEVVGGDIAYEPVPLVTENIPGTLFSAMVPDASTLPAYVARVVPFPTSATPGQRARVELLNGTKNDQSTLLVAPKVVAAGGEVSLLGNASSFDVTATEVQYLAPEAQEAAEAIAKALGVTATASTESSGGIDVRVVVGADRTS